jgi:uncharacterized protein YndB with AHSA1/START domain
MPRVYTSIYIPVPVETVFNYVTTPGNWPKWHPSSLEVSGATDHSLEVGEQTTEKFLVSGRRGIVTWTVRERVFPQRWVIEGKVESRSTRGTISYTTSPQESGTFFEREFVYTVDNPFMALLDRLLVRSNIEAESRQALQQLKQVLTR